MIQITIDTDRPEYAGAAKWLELARVLRDLADKCEQSHAGEIQGLT